MVNSRGFTNQQHQRSGGHGPRWKESLLAVALVGLTGCAELEPLADPQALDLQMMVSSLQGALRENERAMAELRAELDGRRQELSAVVIARAQLEGRLREVERRLVEARHIIDLQRDELLLSRGERDRVLKSRQRVPTKPKAAAKALPVPAPPADELNTIAPAPVPDPAPVPPGIGGPDQTPPPPTSPPGTEQSSAAPPDSSPVVLSAPSGNDADGSAGVGALLRRVAVRAGDTLYSLARRYGVSLGALRAANGLQDDRILVGQALVLPPPREAGRW